MPPPTTPKTNAAVKEFTSLSDLDSLWSMHRNYHDDIMKGSLHQLLESKIEVVPLSSPVEAEETSLECKNGNDQ
jgi:hypothetical protein